jgi:putative copper resistance protein D
VIALLNIFSFLSVLLRGLQLAFEALAVGGVIFLFVVARTTADEALRHRLMRWTIRAAMLLAGTQICIVAINSAILVASTDLNLGDLVGSGFWLSGILVIAGAVALAVTIRTPAAGIAGPAACALILVGSVMASHSVARLEHRAGLAALTLAHHVGSAAWIGGLPYLLVTLRRSENRRAAEVMVSRFSRLAMFSVVMLIAAGATLALAYTGSVSALTGTTYGVMLLSKVILTLFLLAFGALNFGIVRAVRSGGAPTLLPLARFSEAEVGIGLTVLLAAASLTSTPPAIDVLTGRVSGAGIVERMTPRWPRMKTPPLSDLSPVTPFGTTRNPDVPASFVPGQQPSPGSTLADIAWSEYNHHWAGVVVLAIGVLAFLAGRFSWARHWPLAFLGLALFLLIRADSENWPLGPRSFWESFQVAEVAQHRLFVLLIVAFAIFEWAVRNKRLAPERAGLVFPLVCAIGGALLMTHSHSLGNVKEEFLAELSHLPIALLAVVAGWSRWLEIRLPSNQSRSFARIWPVCFVFIGMVLISYRES